MGIETIKGEVLHVDGSNFLLQQLDGEGMRLHIDKHTQLRGYIGRGDRIEATVKDVDDQKHALSIRQV